MSLKPNYQLQVGSKFKWTMSQSLVIPFSDYANLGGNHFIFILFFYPNSNNFLAGCKSKISAIHKETKVQNNYFLG
ncbi:MAG: hypothetical protein IPF46_07120 [Saprospiraceae bacterium]|nr:hypothetical protein [Candidatus Vicinibacter affinis]